MGRRSLKTTKAGKFMNPTDQYRKEQRRKELKKNKKQRQMVREAVLRMKDVGQMLQEVEEIERQELENFGQPQFNEKGLEEKKSKLHASIHRVARYYQQEDPKKAQELKLMIMESEQRRRQMCQVYNSYRAAKSQFAVEDIPMPDTGEGGLAYIPMPAAASLSEESHPQQAGPRDHTLPPPPPPGSPPPDVVEYHVIETAPPKTVRFMEPAGEDGMETGGPGVGGTPVGVDDEEEEEDNDDDDDDDDNKEEGEGSEEEMGDQGELEREGNTRLDKTGKMDSDATIGNEKPAPLGGPGPGVLATGQVGVAPPPPLFPGPFPTARFGFPPAPPPPGPPLPGFDALPPRPLMPPHIPSGAVLSAPPTRVQLDKGQSSSGGSGPSSRSAIISAQPQLRNMTAEVTKFMPTSLRVRRDHPKTKAKLKPTEDGVARHLATGRTQQATGMHVQGDAYDTFMHEMQGLL